MNKLTKTQKQQMIGVAIATLVLMFAVWYLGVQRAETALSDTEKKLVQTQDKLSRAEGTIRQSDEIASKLQAREQVLDKQEAILAPDRDAYAWIISTITPFIQSRKDVKITHYSQPEVSDAGIIPSFPYKWALFHLEGAGYYHDFGKFFADMENNFPYFRVQNLTISANTGATADPEKLNFTFELVVPVKATDNK